MQNRAKEKGLISKNRGVKEYGYPVGLRLSAELFDWLDLISEFELIKRSELLRRWIREKVDKYLRDPRFKRFLKIQREKGRRIPGE